MAVGIRLLCSLLSAAVLCEPEPGAAHGSAGGRAEFQYADRRPATASSLSAAVAADRHLPSRAADPAGAAASLWSIYRRRYQRAPDDYDALSAVVRPEQRPTGTAGTIRKGAELQ